MKRILVFVVASILAGAVSLYAEDTLLRVTVPFEFITENGSFASGDYIVKQYASFTLFNGQEGQGAVYVLGHPVSRMVIPEVITKWQPGATGGAANVQKQKNSGTPQRRSNSGEYCVVFNKYGDQYFLHEVWTGYEGRQLTMSRAERAIRIAGIVKPQRLEFAALVP